MPTIREGFQKARLEELRMLVEVAESGSLSAAARKLRVPKSTVGRAVRRIEDDLGVALVRRMTKGPVLTEPGRVLADMAAPHIAALRDAPAALGRTASEAYGLLRIATLSDVGALVLAPLLPSFLARHPRVRPEVTLGLPPVDLAREGFDVGLRVAMSASLPSSSLVAKKLGPVNIAFYASQQYAARRELPRRLQDIHDHDTIGFFPGDTNVLSIIGPKGIVKLGLRPRVSGNDFFFVREAIALGLGIGPLPWFVAQHELAAGRAVRVLPDHQMTLGTLYVVYPQASPLPPKVRAFTAHLREHVPRLLGPAWSSNGRASAVSKLRHCSPDASNGSTPETKNHTVQRYALVALAVVALGVTACTAPTDGDEPVGQSESAWTRPTDIAEASFDQQQQRAEARRVLRLWLQRGRHRGPAAHEQGDADRRQLGHQRDQRLHLERRDGLPLTAVVALPAALRFTPSAC